MLRRKCKDERLLQLVEKVLRSTAPNADKGIAIGFYLNQWMANFYLENIDREIHQGRIAPCYVKHMDLEFPFHNYDIKQQIINRQGIRVNIN